MKEGWLTITLLSDLCVGTGNAAPGFVDMETALEYGIPVIPAKRIKGCLREVAAELSDSGAVEGTSVDGLFGRPGEQRGGALNVQDGHLYQYYLPDMQCETIKPEEYPAFIQELKDKESQLTPGETAEMLSSLRTQTAIEPDSGSAKAKSLRTMRVVNRGLAFRAKIEWDSRWDDLLQLCVKGLRNMGTGVTRGYGEICCRLDETDSLPETQGEQACQGNSEETVVYQYQVRLETPLIVAAAQDGCFDWIPGSTLLGAMAGLYIEEHGLGDTAHQNERFRRMFLQDGVQFGNAYPMVDCKIFYPCPRLIKRIKYKDFVTNIRCNALKPGEKPQSENALVHFCDSAVEVFSPRKEVRMHHARPKDRGIGHALGEEAGADHKIENPGQLYSYTSLSAGQVFCGTLRGKQNDLLELRRLLEQRKWHVRLGRSRTAEYGRVRIDLCEAQERKKERIQEGRTYTLWFVSPMILFNENQGRYDPDPKGVYRLMPDRLGCEVKPLDGYSQFYGITQTGGYYGKWRLPKPQRPAIAAGTALLVRFTAKEGKLPSIAEIEESFWGENTGEGYGQIKVIPEEWPGRMGRRTAAMEIQESPETSHLTPLLTYKQEKIRQAEEWQEGEQAIRRFQGSLLNMTTLQQLQTIVWSAQRKGTPDLDRTVEEAIDKIANADKRESVSKFFKVCKGKSAAFIESYLQHAIWKARGDSNER